ncbi:MAG: class F420-dependent oxidoreductase [Pseudonocardiales bacterium]|nr:class F420-dependent oxidoreductase [Pseudonocardiales bacterium]
MSRAVTLGLVIPLGFGVEPRQLRDLAAAADRGGLDGIQVGELAGTEIFALVAAMAAVTDRIRLETAVVSTLTRSPALLAMGAATLAELSDGRFVLGLGAGSPIVASWHGKSFYDKPCTAVTDVARDVRAALAGERLEGWGDFRLTGLRPRDDIKIFVSAMNERMLNAAGRCADGVVVNLCSTGEARRLLPIVRAAQDGTRSVEFVANMWAHAGDDIDLAQQRLRWEIAPYLAVPTYRAAAIAIAGAAEVDRAGVAWRSGGRTAAAPLVPQALVDAMLVSGDAGAFEKRLEDYRDAGVDSVRVVPLTSRGGGAEAAHAVVDVLAEVSARRARSLIH